MAFLSIIPLPYYTPIYFNAILCIVLIAALKLAMRGYSLSDFNKKEVKTLVLFLAITIFMGLRPISGRYFGDMGLYNYMFEHYAKGGAVLKDGDELWTYFIRLSSKIMNANIFFLICALLYSAPLYIACKKWFKGHSFLVFLMVVASFSFWAYGTNGIRNGIATSFFVLAISFKNKTMIKYSLIAISYFIHGSILIPFAALLLTIFYNNPKHYLLGWLIVIPISIVLGGVFEGLFSSVGFAGDRTYYLTSDDYNDLFSKTGFRWDFLVYSASAVYAGFYFIVKRGFYDPVYVELFNIYVAANAFWILIIRTSFSNRFAYLSWFLMAFVIFYPFFKQRFFKEQQKVLAYAILAYAGFTYLMNVIIYSNG